MAPEVRVSGPNNEAIGVLSLAEALRMAGDGLRQIQVPRTKESG
jgi:translation initiation factor IF-3